MSGESTLPAALADVRKAYRLLWSYQKRVFDIVRLIAAEFDDMSFYYWRTTGSKQPSSSGVDPTIRPAWDMLPMIQASYLFLPSTVNNNFTQPGQWMLEIHLSSDNGFLETGGGSEPDPADFEDAAETASSITIYAWYCTGAANLNWFSGVWQKTNWPEQGEVAETTEPPFKIFGKKLDLAGLPDKNAVRKAATEFRTTASEALGATLA